jgi:hypothetical protein
VLALAAIVTAAASTVYLVQAQDEKPVPMTIIKTMPVPYIAEHGEFMRHQDLRYWQQ